MPNAGADAAGEEQKLPPAVARGAARIGGQSERDGARRVQGAGAETAKVYKARLGCVQLLGAVVAEQASQRALKHDGERSVGHEGDVLVGRVVVSGPGHAAAGGELGAQRARALGLRRVGEEGVEAALDGALEREGVRCCVSAASA